MLTLLLTTQLLLLLVLTTAIFIFLSTSTWTWWYVIHSIINIMNIIDISVKSKQGNIYIYSTFSTNNIINIHLLQTNWKHCLHSFTELIIPYIYINTNMRFSNSYIWHLYYNIITFFSTALLKIKIYYFWLSSFIKYFCCITSTKIIKPTFF